MSTYAAPVFTGFPAAAIEFMRELAANNSRSWFEAHKQSYLDFVQTPAVALVRTLGEQLQGHFPEVLVDVRTNGSGSLMRIQRDIRFSPDKTPYKTNVVMFFTAGPGKKLETLGFGLQMTLTAVEGGGGIIAFTPPLLERYRQAVLAPASGQALVEAATTVLARPGYGLYTSAAKRVPTGFDRAHPRGEWL